MYAAHSSWIWLYDVYIHSHVELLYIDVHLDTDTEDMDTQRPLPRQAQKSHACQSASRATRLAATAPRHAGFLWSERSKPHRAVQRPQGVGMDPAVENEIICKRTVMENPPCILGMDVP